MSTKKNPCFCGFPYVLPWNYDFLYFFYIFCYWRNFNKFFYIKFFFKLKKKHTKIQSSTITHDAAVSVSPRPILISPYQFLHLNSLTGKEYCVFRIILSVVFKVFIISAKHCKKITMSWLHYNKFLYNKNTLIKLILKDRDPWGSEVFFSRLPSDFAGPLTPELPVKYLG